MKNFVCLCLALILFFQFGCGPSISTVLKKYEAPYREKREQLKKIANSLPPKGSVGDNLSCKEINPAIRYDEKSKDFNADMMMFEQLTDPDNDPDWDLLLGGDLLRSIKWTGPKNPLSESVWGDNGADMEKTLSSALKYQYLVVNRVNTIMPPVVKDKDNYIQGMVTVETFIVDLTNNKTICGFATSAKSLDDLSKVSLDTKTKIERKTTGGGRYSRSKTVETKTTPIPISVQLQNAADSSLYEVSRSQIIDKLKALTKAKIELDN